MYSDEKFDAVTEMVGSVQNDGILELMRNSEWLETFSMDSVVRKATSMGLYVGYPDSVFTADGITAHYAEVGNLSTDSWLDNVKIMKDWNTQQTVDMFENSELPILDGWPVLFSNRDAFRYWLTGVNAFYYPGPSIDGANYFTIPTTITQPPFFDLEWPSAINFGGLGTVCGHGMLLLNLCENL